MGKGARLPCWLPITRSGDEACKQVDPPWLWNPGKTTFEVWNRGVRCPHKKKDSCPTKCFEKKRDKVLNITCLLYKYPKGNLEKKFREINILKENFVLIQQKRSKKNPEKNQSLCCLSLSVNKPEVTLAPISCYRIQEDHPIMSFTLNESGRLALLNVATQVRTQSAFRLVDWFPLTTSN